jgi:uncharacterized protein YaeQ
VYCHKDPAQWLKQLDGATIHRAAALELYAFDRELISELVARLDRRLSMSVAITDRELYVSIGSDNFTGRVRRLEL